MLLDPMGGIVMTNDGNAILREVSLQLIVYLLMQGNGFVCLEHEMSTLNHLC